MSHFLRILTVGVLIFSKGVAVGQLWPQTTPEATDWRATSTTAEAYAFLEILDALAPQGLFRFEKLATTVEGRALLALRTREPARGDTQRARLKVLVIADIHGGEVEGKEAMLQILREIAQGAHRTWLRDVELWVVPVFNPDGNDAVSRGERINQNGPEAGVGSRPNGQGFDLNRDFLKAESPEVRGLLALVRRVDPDLFLDLHTTNGSPHAYELTYAPCLSPLADPGVDALATQRWLPAIRERMAKVHGRRTFDYGNFDRPSEEGAEPTRYRTFDFRSRFSTNWFGLRGRLALLSEAYAYLPFAARIAVTREFVLSSIKTSLAMREDLVASFTAADALLEGAGEGGGPILGSGTRLVPDRRALVLLGRNEAFDHPSGLGKRYVATGEARPIEVALEVAFEATVRDPFPAGWLLADDAAVRRRLLAEGLVVRRLTAEAKLPARRFRIDRRVRSRVPFQGHRAVSLAGELEEATEFLAAEGWLWVSARQRLARAAAALIDPRSEDSLITWNAFDAWLEGEEPELPIRVVPSAASEELQALELSAPLPPEAFPAAAWLPALPEGAAIARTITLSVKEPGVRLADSVFAAHPRWSGRRLSVQWDAAELADDEALAAAIAAERPSRSARALVAAGPGIHRFEAARWTRALSRAGFRRVHVREAQ